MRRSICVLLIVCLGCYSWRTIAKDEALSRIEAGDKVRITKTTGEQSIFHVRTITPDRIDGDGISFLMSEIEKLELRRFSWWKSGLAAGGYFALAVVVAGVATVALVAAAW